MISYGVSTSILCEQCACKLIIVSGRVFYLFCYYNIFPRSIMSEGTTLKIPASFYFSFLNSSCPRVGKSNSTHNATIKPFKTLFKIKFQQRDWSNSNLWLFCWTTKVFFFNINMFFIHIFFLLLFLLLLLTLLLRNKQFFLYFHFSNFYLITILFYLRGNSLSSYFFLYVKSIPNQTSCLPNPWSSNVPTIVIAWLVHNIQKILLFFISFFFPSIFGIIH